MRKSSNLPKIVPTELRKQLSGNVLLQMRRVYINYLFRLCVLKASKEEMSNVSFQHLKAHQAFFRPRQPLDSYWEACRDKALIVTKWFHVKCNTWFCYYQTFHLDVSQTCVIQNFSFFFCSSVPAFYLSPYNEGHRIFLSFFPHSRHQAL